MSYIDLQSTLDGWPYDAEKISVRKILGADGGVRIQMRVELGVVQMEAQGRPDGLRPHGYESLLACLQKRLTKHQERNGTILGFSLSPQECYALRQEASLYYRRYVALFVLEEFTDVVRDTATSLAIFDLCREHALESDDRIALEEFRPYVLMMHARALAYQALREGEPASALAHVNRGIIAVKSHYQQYGHPEAIDASEEIKILGNLGRELSGKVPKDSLLVARRALRAAIEQERFEEAARLRDELKDFYPHEC